ncbi:MAG: EAL domain-containing protein [Arenicellales bacterium]
MPIERQVDWRLLRRVYANEATASLLSVVVAGTLAFVTAVYSDGIWLPAACWLAIALSVLGRFLWARRFAAAGSIDAAGRWERRYAINTTVTGLAWGIGGGLMLWAAATPRGETAVLVVIAAMIAAAVVYQGAVLRAYLGYLLGAQLPISFLLALGRQPGDLYIAVLSLVYCAAMSGIARRYNGDLRAATRLGLEKQQLSDELAATNRKLETDIDARLRAEALLSAERNLLENVARQMSLPRILDELNLDVEALFPGSKCSVVLLDAQHACLRHASAPSLPRAFVEAVDGLEIGPSAGSCGTAMHHKRQVIVEDIASDPLWKDYRDVALAHDLHACWSTPIMSRNDDVLGSFAVYRGAPQSPSHEELETVNKLSRLIALVIEDVRSGERIQLSEQRFRDFASTAADWFWEMDPALRYTYISERKQTTAEADMELIMQRTREELARAVAPGAREAAGETRSGGGSTAITFEFTVATPNNRDLEVASAAKPLFDEERRVIGWRGVGRDITHERELEREIRYQATHDSLTGLLNRRELEVRIQDIVTRGARERDHYVAFLDLDRFKLINDNAGHHAGDAVLKRVAEIMRACLPDEEAVARMGGDEFAACFEAKDARRAVELMESIVREITGFKLGWGSVSLPLGASIGLVRVTGIYRSSTQVMSDADASCYRAKNRGGNQVSLFQPDLDLFTDDARSTGELMRALKDSRTLIHVQRIAALQRPESAPWYEALLRYNVEHGGGASSPSRLIPAAERYGQMGVVDTWVLEQCLEHWASRLASNTLRLSLNLSATSISRADTANEITKLVEQAHISPGALCFELTETSMVSNLDGAAQFMRDLRSLGCGFVIDNFGGGQSNFSYLKKLPGDYLAIDGSYVSTMMIDMGNYAIVDAIHKVGRAHGMLTLAKYVESEAALEALRGLGVEYAQGYFIGRAMPACEMESDMEIPACESPQQADSAVIQ